MLEALVVVPFSDLLDDLGLLYLPRQHAWEQVLPQLWLLLKKLLLLDTEEAVSLKLSLDQFCHQAMDMVCLCNHTKVSQCHHEGLHSGLILLCALSVLLQKLKQVFLLKWRTLLDNPLLPDLLLLVLNSS